MRSVLLLIHSLYRRVVKHSGPLFSLRVKDLSIKDMRRKGMRVCLYVSALGGGGCLRIGFQNGVLFVIYKAILFLHTTGSRDGEEEVQENCWTIFFSLH